MTQSATANLTPEEVAAAAIGRVNVGDSVTVERTVSESDVYLFSGIIGDLSANHLNERHMKTTPFGRRVVQGALLVGLMSAAGADFGIRHALPGAALGYDRIRFLAPAFLGDTIRVEYVVDEVDLERSRIHSKIEVFNQDNELLAVGQHLIKVF
jgi:3-hydroxybutyryl-CoA dehydratase